MIGQIPLGKGFFSKEREMKKGRGKLAKKRMRFEERRSKAEKWVAGYEGERGNAIIKAYRKKFAVDRLKALEELQMLGLTFTQAEIEREQLAVMAYQKQQQAKNAKHKREKQEGSTVNDFQDEHFYFIVGHTSGGAPYGVTWEEMGMKPFEKD